MRTLSPLLSAQFRHAWCCSLLLTLIASGCTPWKLDSALPTAKDKKTSSKAAAKHGEPKFSVAGANLGESQEVSVTSEELFRTIDDLLSAQRFVSASRWLTRHPDAMQETLRKFAFDRQAPASLSFVATWHDRATFGQPSANGWEALLHRLSSEPKRFAEYASSREQYQTLLAQGKAREAAQVPLPQQAGQLQSPLMQWDAAQLTGAAWLLADDPKSAGQSWRQAAEIAKQLTPYHAAQSLLLLSDAERRAGIETAQNTWVAAVHQATSMFNRAASAHDPVLWERLAYSRPVDTAWPAPTVQNWLQYSTPPGVQGLASDLLAELALWNCVAHWYFERGHHQAALVAWKRAEAAAQNQQTKEFFRFKQARSLVLLNQPGAAMATLVAIAKNDSSPLARPATAIIGSMRLQSGNLQQGWALLQKAVEKDDGIEWPERADAEADLGLAYLMMNDTARGMQWLHRAQQRFEQQGDFEALALSLFNEANYLQETKKKAESAQLRERLSQLEQL